MKYSFLMPYINRASQLEKTLKSFKSFYHDRKDYEIILVFDAKCSTMDISRVFQLLDNFNRVFYFLEDKEITNPSIAYNTATSIASGEYLIITNPEVKHEANILAGLDEEFEKNNESYVVCACQSLNAAGGFRRWFQHSLYWPKLFHFCSAISAEIYTQIGGFDKEFAYGIGYEDDDFRDTILKTGINVVQRDDLLTSHQYHDKILSANYTARHNRNRQIWFKKHKNAEQTYNQWRNRK